MTNEKQSQWNEAFDASLRIHYALSVEDVGIHPLRLMAWRAMYPHDPDHAVWALGAALRLTPMMSVLEDCHDPA